MLAVVVNLSTKQKVLRTVTWDLINFYISHNPKSPNRKYDNFWIETVSLPRDSQNFVYRRLRVFKSDIQIVLVISCRNLRNVSEPRSSRVNPDLSLSKSLA